VEDLPPTFIKIKETDGRHGAGGLLGGRLAENGTKWGRNVAGAGSPAGGNPVQQYPASDSPDTQYAGTRHPDAQHPDAQYPDAQHPDTQHPDTHIPDGFWFVLEQLYLASEQDELIGRERILKTAKSSHIPLSQKEIRDILNYMARNGIAKVSRGRGGSRITLIGRNKWEKYKRLTN
ncbi:MAG: AAA family ATPase, partial [Clostridiales bacterium]|nr:AAA family ATPase [Clostridiales bacterium]